MIKVAISGYGHEILADSNESIKVSREKRKLMRFGRRSANLFLNALLKAVQMSNIIDEEDNAFRKGIFYGDFMNLVVDNEHLFELFNICRDEAQDFNKESFFNGIVGNWSVIEILKDLPNIPTFLAAQMTGSKGVSSTILSSCSGGLLSLKDGFDAIQRGDLDIAYVGAASAKLDMVEELKYKLYDLYQEDDYTIADGAAVIILESFSHLEKRKGVLYGFIEKVNTSFSPDTYLNKKLDIKSITYLLDDIRKNSVIESNKLKYIPGSFSKKWLADELRLVNENSDMEVIPSFKEKEVYTFAASGLMEIINYLEWGEDNKDIIVSSLGYGGQNASLYLRTQKEGMITKESLI
jgi:hypothetical protein